MSLLWPELVLLSIFCNFLYFSVTSPFSCHNLKEKGELLCLIIMTAAGVITTHLAVVTVIVTEETPDVMIGAMTDVTTAETDAMTITTTGLGVNM